jgi:5-methylcytosine-specific restriction endonuclease McrA
MEAQVWAFLDHSRYGFKDAGAFDRALRDRRLDIIDAAQRLHVYNERFNDAIQRGTTGKPNVEFRFSRYEAAIRVALSDVPEGRRQRFFTLQQKQNLWDRTAIEDRKCPECDQPLTFEESEVDHIKPFSKGGETVEGNGQLLHRACNRAKGARWDPVEETKEGNV